MDSYRFIYGSAKLPTTPNVYYLLILLLAVHLSLYIMGFYYVASADIPQDIPLCNFNTPSHILGIILY